MSRFAPLAAILLVISACGSPSRAPVPVGVPGPAPLPSGTFSEQGPYLPNAELFVCPGRVTNAPAMDNRRKVENFSPLIVVNGVILASAPANDACLSSGFGPRFGRMHEGIDLQSRPAGIVFTGGPGLVREVSTATGYGKYVLIDHGRGVFTRYAHLDTFTPGLQPGIVVGFGQPVGRMGATGNATAIHLHYEVLRGEWGPRGGWGLTATNPLSWPAFIPDDAAF